MSTYTRAKEVIRTAREQSGRWLVVIGLAALSLFSGPARTQDVYFYARYPYDGNVLPLDLTKTVYGKTMGDVCGQRSGDMFAFNNGVTPPNTIYVGYLPPGTPGGSCGFRQVNRSVDPPVVVTTSVIPPATISCADILDIAATHPGAPVPQGCLLDLPPPKNGGQPCRLCRKPCPTCGNPINSGTGNKYQAETDLGAAIAGGLSFKRYYNSSREASPTKVFGGYWQHNYSRKILIVGNGSQSQYFTADGALLTFQLVGTTWTPDADIPDVLLELKDSNGVRTGWKYIVAANDDTETYDGSGNLLSIQNRAGLATTLVYSDGTNGASSGNGGFVLDAAGNPTAAVLPQGLLLRVRDAFGRTLQFGYDARYRIVAIADPAGGVIRYAYDLMSNLTGVTYPDGKTRTYLYNEPAQTSGANFPYQLTGIVDENGARFATFAYDQQGRAIKTTHLAGGVEVDRFTVSYDAPGSQSTVTDARGTARTVALQTVVGLVQATGETQPAASGSGTASTTVVYDANGNAVQRTDLNGNRTNYAYDLARNLETSRTEGLTASGGTTPQTRTISTQWHPTFRLPVKVAEPLRITAYSYDPNVVSTTWTRGTVFVCHNSGCSTVYTDISYVPGTDPAAACATASALAFFFSGATFGGARGSGDSGECFYNQGSTQPAFGNWQIVAGCVSGTFPNQTFTPANSGTCESAATPASDTVCGATAGLCTKTVQATNDADGSQGFGATPVGTPRKWAYTYNSNGSVLTVNGPRTDVADVTTYTYYSNTDADLGKRGNVATITNALGHQTSIAAYNAHGQPLTTIDANGVTTTLAYDARLRLTSRNFGGELTSYDHDDVGNLTKVTLPDGSYLSYAYDTAHRLTAITDTLGNRISYTLDATGNRTVEEVRDPTNQLAQLRSRVYNDLNRLFRELGAQNQTTEYAYDDQGNVTSVKDPLNHTTVNAYDTLNRLRQVTDPALGVTQYAYNGLDALTQVTDPRSLATSYTVDGLGNLTQQASPDTGATINSYDDAGNLLTQTDAKGQVTTYAYDALNRVTLITFNDGSRQSYAYDQGTNGVGRLSSITETNAANQVTSVIAYAYEQHGRVASETRTVNGVAYATAYSYDTFGRMSGMTYPSGRTAAYTFDALGRVSGITTTKPGDAPQTVVSGVTYHPFGGVKGYTLGNGQVYTRSIDLDGRIASYTLGSQSFAIGYDAASRITFIADAANPANSNTYDYDSLDRLISAVLPSTPYAYSYDAVGNRLSRTAGSSTDTYAYSGTSNRIASITPSAGPVHSFVFDANGSTTADGNNTYAYDVRGRMASAMSSIGTTTYQVNALGQRVRKTNSFGDSVFHYDTKGHLIAETDAAGALKREILYLGDIPVGVVQ